MKSEIVRDRAEFEKKTAAMQERRDTFRDGAHWNRRHLDNPGALIAHLDANFPLPVLEEPSPTVRGPTGNGWRVVADEEDERFMELQSRAYTYSSFEKRMSFPPSDLPAIVLALLGPEGTAEFAMKAVRAAWPWLAQDSPSNRAAIELSYPELVSDAGGTHG